jgi:hypothetical protein
MVSHAVVDEMIASRPEVAEGNFDGCPAVLIGLKVATKATMRDARGARRLAAAPRSAADGYAPTLVRRRR